MTSIGTAARRLRIVTLAIVAFIILASLAALAVLAGLVPVDGPVRVAITQGALGPIGAAVALSLVNGLFVAALLQLAAMLRGVEAGLPFGAARHLRGFALFLFLALLAGVLAEPVIGLVSGALGISLDISSGEAMMLLVAALLFFVARLLDEAQRVADEHAQIV